MVRLEVIELAEPMSSALEDLKLYAAVADDSQKGILMSSLRSAMDAVQRVADSALLAGRWRVCVDEHPGVVSVYMGGKVEKVTDGQGLPVSFIQRGRKVYLSTEDYVEVEFTTEVIPAEYARLLPVICQYATALYDGQDDKTLNSILKQCL